MIDTRIDEALQNWARWVRLRPHQGHCRSIEHRYKLRRIDDTRYGWGAWQTTPVMPPLPEVDALAALEVERCMRFVPKGPRTALKFKYVLRAPRAWCCRRLVIPYDYWDTHIADAQQMVANLLKKRLTAQKADRRMTEQFAIAV